MAHISSIRGPGSTCVATGAVGAGICGYVTWASDAADDGPFTYPSAMPGFTGLQMVLALSQVGLIVGLVGLRWAGAVPDTRRARVGQCAAVAALAGLIVTEGVAISVPVSSLDATPPAFGMVYAGYTLILGIAMLAVGLELARGGTWLHSRRWLSLVLGMWVLGAGLPSLAVGHDAAGWVRAVSLVGFALLGLVLMSAVGAGPADAALSTVGRSARMFAVVTWVYVAAFGSSAIPVAAYLSQNGRLPSFLGIFDMFGGPRVDRLDTGMHVLVILAFFGATLVAAWSAWLVRNGSRSGAVITVAVLPVEAAFWVVFLMPVPWFLGLVRLALLGVAWRGSVGREVTAHTNDPATRSGAST